MEYFPKELWFEVFEYIDENDLLTLTQTCKNFYSMIVKTKLLDRFTMCITDDRKIEEWKNVKRSYSKLKITECNDLERFMEIFEEFGKNLAKISIIKSQVNVSILKKIFLLCPKINFVTISEIQIGQEDDFESSHLPSYRDLKIYFEDSNPSIFEILKNCQATELHIDNKCSAQNVNFDSVKKFLRSQENLQSLSLMYFSLNTNLFTDNMLDFVKFRLKSFLMNNVYLVTENVARFQTFMINHIDTLTCLHVQSPFIDISFFRQFSTLKNLHISHTNAFFDTFENIEILTVENISGNWIMKFPNVRDLTMIYKYGVFLGMYADLVNLTQLQSLSIIESKIPELNIPSVRKLSLKNATLCAKMPFKYEANQIRELNIDSCSSIEWIADFLAQETTRLRMMRIKNMKIIDYVRKMIVEKGREKIQTLILIDS